jgi:stringent starvation protein B
MTLRDIRPYMLHAHIQWLDDSGEIPHLLVLNGSGVVFPPHLRESPHLLFNVSSEACQGLDIRDGGVSFSGRFNGRVFKVEFPLDAVVSVQNKAASFMVSFASQEEMMNGLGPNEPEKNSNEAPQKMQISTALGVDANTEEKVRPARRSLQLVKGLNNSA